MVLPLQFILFYLYFIILYRLTQQIFYEFFITYFSACNPAKTEVSYDTTEGGIGLEKDSALYQLMDTRMHSVMNGIVSSDGEYQAILRRSDIYSGELDRMDLSKEIRLLIDRYVSEQNALGSRFGMLAHLLGFAGFPACRSHPPPWRASHRRTASSAVPALRSFSPPPAACG